MGIIYSSKSFKRGTKLMHDVYKLYQINLIPNLMCWVCVKILFFFVLNLPLNYMNTYETIATK